MLPDNYYAKINLGSWPVLPIFKVLQDLSNLEDQGMYNTFNMGIGMIVAMEESEAHKAIKSLEEIGEQAYIIGTVKEGKSGVELC